MRRAKIVRWARRVILGLIVMVATLAVAGATYQALATKVDERRHPPSGELVDVNGHKLHINCAGEGSPAVLLESGMGENYLTWSRVQPQLAQTTRVCAYDRAGLGWSEPSDAPRDSRHVAGELHVLLEEAGIKGPYVLVGHSLGGLHARVFADRYPDEVVGVVLVDSSSENQPLPDEDAPAGDTKPGVEVFTEGYRQTEIQLTLCRILSPVGLVRLSGMNEWPELPARVRAEAKAASNRTGTCSAAAREFGAVADSAAQARSAGSLGDLPLVVVSRGDAPDVGGLPPEEAERMKHSEELWRALQDGLVGLSSEGIQIVAERSGHYVQIDQPELVVEATRRVVEEARHSRAAS